MSGDGKKKATKKMNYRERQSINYQQGADPPFLAQMKKQLGYREYTIEDKFNDEENEEVEEDLSRDWGDIRNMREEDRPQIVVIDSERDLTTAELKKEIDKKREEDEKRMILEGRITFRKPEKRPIQPNTKEEATGSKTAKNIGRRGKEKSEKTDEGDEEGKKQPKQQMEPTNRRLLSFGEDEED